MKTFTLTLSDSASNTALHLAGDYGVPVELFLSSQMEDFLDSQVTNAEITKPDDKGINQRTWPLPNNSESMPDTLLQVLRVCTYVYKDGNVPLTETRTREQLIEALHKVAKELGVGYSTIRDKCCTTRRLGLPGVFVNTETFLNWLQQPESLRDHLCRKFPKFVEEIRKKFSELLPKRF